MGNFQSLRDLPDSIRPAEVTAKMQEKQDMNLGETIPNTIKLVPLKGGGYFRQYEWKPDGYGQHLEKERKERQDARQRMVDLHGEDFKVIKVKKQLKHEPMLGEDDRLHELLKEDDPYEQTVEEVMRNKWIEESKKLYGDFMPFAKAKGLDDVSKG